jgi:hypothetical protein
MTTTLPEFLTENHESTDANEEVLREVERIIRLRTQGTVRDIQVVFNGEKIVVTGRTSTYYSKQLVSWAAADAANGRDVLNEIEVEVDR